jgi:hypothetical protein
MNSSDYFFAKYHVDGSLIWVKSFGNGNAEIPTDIETDENNQIYLTGAFQGPVDFDTGPGVFTMNSTGVHTIFVSKFDSAGNFSWAIKMGSISTCSPTEMKINKNSSVFLTGFFENSVDFDPGPGTVQITAPGSFGNIFIASYDSLGNYKWVNSFGGINTDMGLGLTLDSLGFVYTTGYFVGSIDFDPGPDSSILNGAQPTFVTKYKDNGDFVWGQVLRENSKGIALKVDKSGEVIVSGSFLNKFPLCLPAMVVRTFI